MDDNIKEAEQTVSQRQETGVAQERREIGTEEIEQQPLEEVEAQSQHQKQPEDISKATEEEEENIPLLSEEDGDILSDIMGLLERSRTLCCYDESGDRRYSARQRQSLTCKVCGKVYRKLSNAVDHVRMHLAHRPYSCKHCGKSYTQSSNRDRH